MVWHAWKELKLEAVGHGQLVRLLIVSLSPVSAVLFVSIFKVLLSPLNFHQNISTNIAHVVQISSFHD